MKSILRGMGVLAAVASLASAATMTMTGMVSDSMCGASHARMIASTKAPT